ncbi:hypothetical protein QYE76_009921 [Lolium multiflorum]|uniref:Integrase catalytic domain-containing protein n=1 Tax=Lolium multiflorum TaxID=4521 RepID=A0AAD8TVY3_LOLMU|nr:hypothetical protein QYE76_009921 [Lolium multiflorum]
MVLDPTIGTTRRSVRFSRVLIDGGSSINILYRDTARKLGIQDAELRPTPTVFHGIVPGHRCRRSAGSRWSCLAQGVITIAGDYRRSMDCATQSSKMAQTLVIATQKQLIHDAVALAKAAQADMPAAGNPAGTTHFTGRQHQEDPAGPGAATSHYGVYMAAKKLKHYFQEHPIKVVATAPLAEIIGSKDANGRVAKWALELAAHTILYEPRTAIKSQILADFFVDWAEMQYLPPVPDSTHWKMHFDGSKMRNGLGAGVVLTSPKGDRLDYVLQIHFTASNNVAEYEALIHGLKLAKEIGVRRILCFGDSDLVIQQASGDWDAKDANMASYRFHVQQLSGFFDGCEFHHVPRANNEAADALSKIGSTRQAIPPGIALAVLKKPSIIPDAEELVKKCNGCQRFAKKRHQPASALKTIPITWPFAVWGLDMVGPFKTARGGMTHLLVMIDKFTKWIEAKPIKKLDGSTAVTFLKEIIVRFGYPHSIITDNGSNFSQGIFSRYCGEMGIRMALASVAHPESNGQVEKANGLVLAGIRPRLVEPLERAAGCWIEELPNVLWSLRTTTNRSAGFTPFFLVYGAKPSCRLISSTTRQGSSCTPPKPKKLAKMESTWSKRPGCWLRPDLPSTSKASDAITAGRSSP